MGATMIRNRIKELRHVRAGELRADDRNWRRHPKGQRAALEQMLQRNGYADALLTRETPDGLVIIDGHLRAELDAEQVVPVLVTDLSEAEAGELLLTLDPLAAMAEADTQALAELANSMPDDEDFRELPDRPTRRRPVSAAYAGRRPRRRSRTARGACHTARRRVDTGTAPAHVRRLAGQGGRR